MNVEVRSRREGADEFPPGASMTATTQINRVCEIPSKSQKNVLNRAYSCLIAPKKIPARMIGGANTKGKEMGLRARKGACGTIDNSRNHTDNDNHTNDVSFETRFFALILKKCEELLHLKHVRVDRLQR